MNAKKKWKFKVKDKNSPSLPVALEKIRKYGLREEAVRMQDLILCPLGKK